MFFYFEIICTYISINIDFNLINAAKSECNNLNLNITNSFKVFKSGKICERIKNSIKQICFKFIRVTSINAVKAYIIIKLKST